MEIKKNIFRAYDVRGVYPEEINDYTAYIFGKAFGTYVQNLGKSKVVVGHDNRKSSNSLTDNLIRGLLETGVDVTHLGLVTTPMYYYSWEVLNIPSGIMVTASHNPKDDNGFKFAFDERGNAKGEMIEEFYNFLIKGEFKKGRGKLYSYNIEKEYIELFKNTIDIQNKVKVVLDLGNGTTSIIARKIYENYNLDLDIIFEESDSTFPNHHPDPCVEDNLRYLKQRVIQTGADVGIGFDGDGDRLGVVLENGEYIQCDKYMAVIIRNIINNVSNKTFLFDVKCSKMLEDEIKKLGGTPFCYKTGNSYTKNKTAEMDLAFGGEFSGHVYFRDKFKGFDSGLYAGLRLIEILSKTEKKASELLEGLEHYYSTDEIKIKSTDTKKYEIVEGILNYAKEKKYNYLDIDGVKVIFEDGFALVRVSNTGPNVTARFEGKTENRLNEIKDEFSKIINTLL